MPLVFATGQGAPDRPSVAATAKLADSRVHFLPFPIGAKTEPGLRSSNRSLRVCLSILAVGPHDSRGSRGSRSQALPGNALAARLCLADFPFGRQSLPCSTFPGRAWERGFPLAPKSIGAPLPYGRGSFRQRFGFSAGQGRKADAARDRGLSALPSSAASGARATRITWSLFAAVSGLKNAIIGSMTTSPASTLDCWVGEPPALCRRAGRRG